MADTTAIQRTINVLQKRRFWAYTLIYALIWLILTGDDPASWGFGIPTIFIAALLSLFWTPPSLKYPRLSALLLFALFFSKQSFLSGVDVLRRTLSLRMDLNPDLIPFSTYLPAGAPQIFFANAISLIPGTLSVDIEENSVLVHTLDADLPVWATIQKLQGHVAILFNVDPDDQELP